MRRILGLTLTGAFPRPSLPGNARNILTMINDQATTELLDRLKNGDPYIVAGEVKRKPVSARDLALVAAITFDKRALARNAPTSDGDRDLTLEELANSLRTYAQSKREREGVGENSRD